MRRHCDECGDEYRALRSTSRFCSGACRQRAHRASTPTPTKECQYGDEGHDYVEHLVEVFDSKPYVSSNIEDAHKKWIKGRGADKTTVVPSWGPK